ncbi:MAG: YdcF family protein [Acidobacteriota bacterium]
MTAAGSYLVSASQPVKAEIVLVLSGDGSGDRILKAAELVREGYAPNVLVSGPDMNYGLYECDMAIPFAVKHGYPEAYFTHFENSGRSTADEAQFAVKELRRRGIHRLMIVTSDYHTRRALRDYRLIAPDLDMTMVAAKDRNFSPDGWWHSREGRKTFLYEWMKTFASWFEN